MQRHLLVSAITMLASSLSSGWAADSQQAELAPGKMHESCHPMASEDVMHFTFSASSEIVFNIHYHVGRAVHYPVPDQQVMQMKDKFTAILPKTYCLTWKNRQESPASLAYSVEIRGN